MPIIITVRRDLSLQIADGDTQVDLDLSAPHAHQLVGMLVGVLSARLANTPDGDLTRLIYRLAEQALEFAERLPHVTLDSERQLLATLAIERGFAGLSLLRKDLQTLEDLENAPKH